MTAGPDRVARVVDALGIAVLLAPGTEFAFRHLPSSSSAALAALGPHDAADPVRALTRIAVDRTSHLTAHAGVVGVAGGAVAFPGVSGAGKSTLVAACVRAGMDYFCDEVLALDRATGDAVPFARPLALAARSRRILGLDDDTDDELFVDPAALGGVATDAVPLRHVVVPRRRPGPATLSPLGADQALRALLPRCFNHFRDPAASWRLLAAVCGGVRVWQIEYDDAGEAAALLIGQLVSRSRV